jgi:hypothetical protein
MTQNWHGAQWVLATWMTLCTFLPLMLRLAMWNNSPKAGMKNWETWWAEEFGRQAARWALIVVLWWGGFWS